MKRESVIIFLASALIFQLLKKVRPKNCSGWMNFHMVHFHEWPYTDVGGWMQFPNKCIQASKCLCGSALLLSAGFLHQDWDMGMPLVLVCVMWCVIDMDNVQECDNVTMRPGDLWHALIRPVIIFTTLYITRPMEVHTHQSCTAPVQSLIFAQIKSPDIIHLQCQSSLASIHYS